MIRSMTGYGRGQATLNGRDILVEIRSVNNRYYDFSARIPRVYGYLEERLKSLLQGSVSRGKVEVATVINNLQNCNEEIAINQNTANGYIVALRKANEELKLNDDITLSRLARFPDIFTVHKVAEDEGIIWESVREVAEVALGKFIEMREAEGQRMQADILSHLNFLENNVEVIKQRATIVTENYRNRLLTKIKEIISDHDIDEGRVLTEVAVFAEKVAVDEETVRLDSHIAQFKELMNVSDAVGRKLDFLVQEMNREVNTIGSKAQDLEITRIIVDMKSEIEKIREQIQNIE